MEVPAEIVVEKVEEVSEPVVEETVVEAVEEVPVQEAEPEIVDVSEIEHPQVEPQHEQEDVSALAAAIQPISLSQLEESIVSPTVPVVEAPVTTIHHVPVNVLKAGEIRLGKLGDLEAVDDEFSFGGFDATPIPAPVQQPVVAAPVVSSPPPAAAAAAPASWDLGKQTQEVPLVSAPQVVAPPAPVVDSLLSATAGNEAHHGYATSYGQEHTSQQGGRYGEDHLAPPPGLHDVSKQDHQRRGGNSQRGARGGQGGMQQGQQQSQPQQQAPQQQPYYPSMMGMGMGMGVMPDFMGAYYPGMPSQPPAAQSSVQSQVGGSQSQSQSAPMQPTQPHQQGGGFYPYAAYPPYGYPPYFQGGYGYPQYPGPQQGGRGGYPSYGGGAQGYDASPYGSYSSGGRDMYMSPQPTQQSQPKSQGSSGGQGASQAPQSQQGSGLYPQSTGGYSRDSTGYSTGGYWNQGSYGSTGRK